MKAKALALAGIIVAAPMTSVKAHRLEGRIEHAGVGGEQQLDRLMFQSSWQTSTSFPKFESYQAA